MKLIVVMLLFISGEVIAQHHVAHFSYWKPRAGEAQRFENGYKQHLKWHKDNGDKWSWYGWYIISGPRYGLFVDATFNHAWSDFDNPVKPAEDGADNNLHTHPFGIFEGGYKMIQLPSLSIGDSNGLRSKYLRFVTINVTDPEAGKKVIERWKTSYQPGGVKTLLTFKMVDGGSLNQLLVIIGLNSFQEFSKVENLQEELSAIETALKIKTITSITAETLIYRADMSWLQE
ncbi:hypothetical protein FAM09_27480 [Niastella caeni]|uniref:Uncharacterized protein n=1 Tax=Niastella caeni TaxID=2569763 RepID=A0A4S8HCQ9_9BACT|nr:hypothetical protein [Niastella caeni]THU32535.1 hypothetical protein FAM09_27480 [Niastella caeni]